MSLEDPALLTVQSLDESLKDLVEWEGFGIYLPKMNYSMITMINRNHPGNCIKQKQALYDEWLRAYPDATWDDVVKALKKAKEVSLALIIKRKYIKKFKAHHHDKSNEEKVTRETVNKSVITGLRQLNQSFKDLANDIEKKCKQLISNNVLSLNDLSRPLKQSPSSLSNFTTPKTTEKFFDSIRCHYSTFLDCGILEDIISIMPDSNDLALKFNGYQEQIRKFKSEAPIQSLRDKLIPYIHEDLEKITIKVVFILEDAWGSKDMNLFETLLETMFPGLSEKMKWYKIIPGSICITLTTDRDDEDTLVSMGKEKQDFLRILGVASLSINGNEVFNESESKSFSFESALLEASLSANTEALLFLLNVIQVSVDHQDKDGNTALDIAVDNNHIEVAQILLNAKANPSHQRDDGNTPLHIACYKGYTQLHVALMLIQYGANPSIPNTKGDTPFLSSIRGNMMEVVTIIAPKLPQSQILPALILACRLGYSDIISFLLQYIDPPGSSTIHQYCANGNLALAAEHIVRFSEDINSSLVLGITPLMIASSCGHIEVVECLIEANADVNRIDEDGYSPLAYAITGSGSVPVIECLLQAGANSCITVGGDSLLQMAKQRGNSDLVDLLLQFMALQLYNMFSSLVEKIQEDLTSDIDQHKTTLQEIQSKLLSDPEFSHIEGIAEASSCSELFTILQPHYNFLNWKVISCLSERLKHDGYFKKVEILEEDLTIQSLPQAASLIPQSLSLPSLSSTGELSVSLDKQWGDKTLFNLRGLNALFFSSLARLMSHLTVSVTQQEIIVSYQIPRSTKVADRIKSIVTVLQKDKLPILLGITNIKLNNEAILQIGRNQLFSFDAIILNSLHPEAFSLPSTEVLKIAKFLLKFKNINIDYEHTDGTDSITALTVACALGNKPVVDLLLSHGAHPNIGDLTPLMAASMNGHLDIVKALVNKCPSAVNTVYTVIQEFKRSPLVFACTNNHIDVVEFLLENGADPNFSRSDGVNLLMVTITFQQLDIAKLLLEAGADPHIINNKGSNALMMASFEDNVEGVKLLLRYNANYKHTRSKSGFIPMDAFAYACFGGNKKTVDVYLSNTDLSDRSLSLGWYVACINNKVHLIGYLVNSLPQLSIGRREFVTACVEGDLAYIRNNLGNPDDVFVHGVTPLMIACSCDNTSIVEALLNAGASAVKEDEFGKKAIDYCKKHSSIPDILRARFGNEPMKRTFDKEKLFEDIAPVTARKGIPAVDEYSLSSTPFIY